MAITYPVRIKAGASSVTIFRSPVKKRSKTYDSYVLSYYEGLTRTRRHFNDYEIVRAESGRVVANLISTDTRALELTGEDAHIVSRAKEVFTHLNLPLDLVAFEYAEACKILGGKRILEASKLYAAHAGTTIKTGLSLCGVLPLDTLAKDGVHPNVVGHDQITKVIQLVVLSTMRIAAPL